MDTLRCFVRTALLAVLVITAIAAAALANGYETYPPPLVWSPGGTQLAAAVPDQWPAHGSTFPGELRLYELDGSYMVLATGEVGSPSFSADGACVACVVNGRVVLLDNPHSLCEIIVDREDVLDVRFGPAMDGGGGEVLYFSAGERFYGCDVYSVVPGGVPQLVTGSGPGASCLAPSPSPDASALLLLRQGGWEDDTTSAAYERIHWLARGGDGHSTVQATLPQLRPADYHESNICWLSGDTILFQRGGWGDWRLVRKQLPDGVEYIVLTDAQQPAASADGQLIAFTRRDYRTKQAESYDWDVAPSVWLKRLSYRRQVQLSPEGTAAELPALSPDGSRIAWLQQDTEGGALVAIQDTPLGG